MSRDQKTTIVYGILSVVLVLVVLPAEYSIDPTGLGRMMGLTDIS
jgi:hypothetical protein